MVKYWLIIICSSLYILLAVGTMFYIIRRGVLTHLQHKREDTTSLQARVKDKIARQGFHGVNWQIGTIQHLAVFECEDGQERTFDVSESVWDTIDEGDAGVLTFQGPHILAFRTTSNASQADAAYERLTRR